MHNELSYAAQWPARLLFFCQIAAETGGATPVVDAELWLESLDPEVRADFAGGVRYQQNLHDGMGLGKSWQETFETDGPRRRSRRSSPAPAATWEWTADGLRVIQLRPATLRHPVTGAEVWFNQADQWHPAGLDDEIARVMTQVMTPGRAAPVGRPSPTAPRSPTSTSSRSATGGWRRRSTWTGGSATCC